MQQIDLKGLTGIILVLVLHAAAPPAFGRDLPEARRLYNLGRYEAAIDAVSAVLSDPASRHVALVVLGRARLERFRQTAEPGDLAGARDALTEVDASRLDARDRLELLVGLGEALYLDDLFMPAADLLETAVKDAPLLDASARNQLLDWWATALDRQAQARPASDRRPIYDRISTRMNAELTRDPGTAAAAYWVTVAARATGDVDRAWDLARAGWVRAQLTPDRGAGLRPDLDRLVREAIIPERARRIHAAGGDVDQATSGLTAEWEGFVGKWTK